MNEDNQTLVEQPKQPVEQVDTPGASDAPTSTEATTDEPATKQEQEAEEAVVAGVEAVGAVALFFKRIKTFFTTIWETPKYRYSTLAGLVAVIAVLFLVPTTRWGIFNTAGFRANAQLTILDQNTQLPLRDVEVAIGDSQTWTDNEGLAYLEDVRLGSNELRVRKSAYAEIVQTVDIGFGSNLIESGALTPIGTSFDFEITDWLTKQPIEGATVQFGGSSVFSAADGKAVLTIPPTDDIQFGATVYADGYADQTVVVNTATEEPTAVGMMIDERNYYISRASGNYDVFSSKLDGSDPQLVVAGTGNERSDTTFSVAPTNRHAALVSVRNNVTREEERYNFILDELNIVDLQTSSLSPVTSSERIELVGWTNNHLIFVEVKSGESARSADRTRLAAYDIATGRTNTLVESNYFQDVRLVGDRIFYAPGLSSKQSEPKEHLYSVKFDGSDPQTVLEKSTSSIIRSEFDMLSLSTYDAEERKTIHYDYNLATGQLSERAARATNNYYYELNEAGTNTATIVSRDGKGVLLVSEDGGEQRTVFTKVGAKLPLRWVGEHRIIFRVVDIEGTADYIVDIRGGEPQKITDVTDVAGNDIWYYYRGL